MAAGLYGKKPVKIVLCPDLREFMSFKNTVASCTNELKHFVAELKKTEGHKYKSWPEIDYSMIEGRPLWYLETLMTHHKEHGEDLMKAAT